MHGNSGNPHGGENDRRCKVFLLLRWRRRRRWRRQQRRLTVWNRGLFIRSLYSMLLEKTWTYLLHTYNIQNKIYGCKWRYFAFEFINNFFCCRCCWCCCCCRCCCCCCCCCCGCCRFWCYLVLFNILHVFEVLCYYWDGFSCI